MLAPNANARRKFGAPCSSSRPVRTLSRTLCTPAGGLRRPTGALCTLAWSLCKPSGRLCTPALALSTPPGLACTPDEGLCTPDGVVCTLDGTLRTPAEVVCTPAQLMCTPAQLMCTPAGAPRATADSLPRVVKVQRLTARHRQTLARRSSGERMRVIGFFDCVDNCSRSRPPPGSNSRHGKNHRRISG
jgi:hypothetical protein